jgi:hypothetical protein
VNGFGFGWELEGFGRTLRGGWRRGGTIVFRDFMCWMRVVCLGLACLAKSCIAFDL